jgi:hypothetical protein
MATSIQADFAVITETRSPASARKKVTDELIAELSAEMKSLYPDWEENESPTADLVLQEEFEVFPGRMKLKVMVNHSQEQLEKNLEKFVNHPERIIERIEFHPVPSVTGGVIHTAYIIYEGTESENFRREVLR